MLRRLSWFFWKFSYKSTASLKRSRLRLVLPEFDFGDRVTGVEPFKLESISWLLFTVEELKAKILPIELSPSLKLFAFTATLLSLAY